MTADVHTLDFLPLRRTSEGEWVEATCWLDEGIERVVMGCVCGWHGRELTAADLGVPPAAFAGDIADEPLFAQVSNEMEAAHAAEIVPAVNDLADPATVEKASAGR
ncbi:hypothetical protein ACI8AK_02475 [Geodermatophilus sp. SYSU D00867]